VILRILAQESLESESRLKTYEGKMFRGLKLEFWNGSLGVLGITKYVEGFGVKR
jgi:hypothetical protein